MKTLSGTKAAYKVGGSETNQTPNGMPIIAGRNLHWGFPYPTVCGFAQSDRFFTRGQQDSILMMSQLG